MSGTAPQHLRAQAERQWVICPESRTKPKAAFFLPGQLERILATPFNTEGPHAAMLGNVERVHSATEAYMVRDVLLVDGVLYKRDSCDHLRPRQSSMLKLTIEQEFKRAALFSTPGGHRYFGQWLLDDCLTYPLAVLEGDPVMPEQPRWLHGDEYEAHLGMNPIRLSSVHFEELVLFRDIGQNVSKKQRRDAMRAKLLEPYQYKPHPGVFLLRGAAGQRRVLINELEIAEQLENNRGFKVIDPLKMTVSDILQCCAGAETIVGVEGSALVNGVNLLAKHGRILVLQPPRRFVWVFKDIADRDELHFGFVVGEEVGEDFFINADEVERTLDLFPANCP